MSLPEFFGERTRTGSQGSLSSPRRIPGSSDSIDGTSISEANYGSMRGRAESRSSALNPSTASQREPTRSAIHLSYRAPQAPFDHAQYSRSVREDTAELASYALSDKASVRSVSPSRRRSSQTQLESYFAQGPEADLSANNEQEGLHHHTIQEVSEPASPESSPMAKSPATSALTDMLKRSPPNTLPKNGFISHPGNLDGSTEADTDEDPAQPRLPITDNNMITESSEQTPLLSKYRSAETHHPDWIRGEQDIEGQVPRRQPSWPKLHQVVMWPKQKGVAVLRTIANPKTWDRKAIVKHGVVDPARCMPAAVLGVLLNMLDALSYGMILFPLGNPIFESLGPAGISMFYVSTIVAQLVYSLGGSGFKSVVGSEMIEVVPFFHKMAFLIMSTVGEEDPQSVIATTITAYAISTMFTGLVFFLMGLAKFGYIIGFIPRQLLTACIGGVGLFLVITGIEVTADLGGNLEYNIPTLQKLFSSDTILLWSIPLILAVLFRISKFKITSEYWMSAYVIGIFAVFWFFIGAIPRLQFEDLRQKGWFFQAPASDEPWWYFYTLYNFKLVHWGAIASTIPSMLSLTFFGILHVPINVPALAFKLQYDDVNLDRELMAHGVSNMLSGVSGSIQNYLVYTNTVAVVDAGGNNRTTGVLIAALTFLLMTEGLRTIGYIPRMMVGALIFMLGFELMEDALVVTWKKLRPLEYCTVVVVVVVMGLHDFVAGILVGILLSFAALIFQSSRIPAIRASYTGEIAGSTVRRNPVQHRYLRDVGSQIHVTKLAGYLFFGTIVSVEDRVQALIEDKAYHARPIRFLVLDLTHVTDIDYTAAEVFNRLNRVFNNRGVTLVMSGIPEGGKLSTTLQNVGLGDDDNRVLQFEDLNSALESCENELLKTLYSSKEARASRHAPTALVDVPSNGKTMSHSLDTQFSSPRRTQLQQMATFALDEGPSETRYINFKEPLRLILQTFQGLTDKNEDFWFRVTPFFSRREFLAGATLFQTGDPADGFYLVEQGILRADYDLPQGKYFESIVAGTTCGELPFFSETQRTAVVHAERDCITWYMDRRSWEKLQKEDAEVANELLRISLKLTSERMTNITSYVLTTAG